MFHGDDDIDWGEIATEVGSVLGGYAKGSGEGRVAETNLAQGADRLALDRYNTGLNADNVDLSQRKFALGAPSSRANQSVRGDIMANAQDAQTTGLPSFIQKGTVSGEDRNH